MATGTLRVLNGNATGFSDVQIGVVFQALDPFEETKGVVDVSGRLEMAGELLVGFNSDAPNSGRLGNGKLIVESLTNIGSLGDRLAVGVTKSFGNARGVIDAPGVGDGVTVENVQVGVSIGSGGVAFGEVTMGGGLTGLGGSLQVGVSGNREPDKTSFAGGKATGDLTVLGGDITGFDSVEIGTSFGPGAATGTLNARSLTGTGDGDLAIGVSSGTFNSIGGTATGEATFTTGTVSGFNNINVGVGGIGGGTANGTVLLENAIIIGTDMFVGGHQNPAASALGLVSLDQSLIDLSGSLFLGGPNALGGGSNLFFELDGLTRVDEYGAINANTAFLDGMAAILFNFIPTVGVHTFDLIRTQTALGGIDGDFLTNPDIFGLDTSFTAVTDIVQDGSFDIYRLTIESTNDAVGDGNDDSDDAGDIGGDPNDSQAVPEPITATLGLMGLATLGLATRRRAA
jgi:hypothetical protein